MGQTCCNDNNVDKEGIFPMLNQEPTTGYAWN